MSIESSRAHARIHKVFYPCNRCHLAILSDNQRVTCGNEVTRVTTNGVFALIFTQHKGTEAQSFYYFSVSLYLRISVSPYLHISVSPYLCVYQNTAWGCEAPGSEGRSPGLRGAKVPPPRVEAPGSVGRRYGLHDPWGLSLSPLGIILLPPKGCLA